VLATHVSALRPRDLTSPRWAGFRPGAGGLSPACALAGAGMPVDAGACCAGAGAGARPASRVPIGSEGRAFSVPKGGFVNGAAAHALDFDDGQRRNRFHPGGGVFRQAFAAAEGAGRGLWHGSSRPVVQA